MTEDNLYYYKGTVTKVYDGDTITINFSLGFHTWIMKQIIRLQGVNTPEVRGESKEQGKISRDALAARILGKDVIIKTKKGDKKDKYGRWLGVIYLDGENINQWLIDNGYGVPFMK
jgi:micrococcal nuclease